MSDSTIADADFESSENSLLEFYAEAFGHSVPHRVVNRDFVAREDLETRDLSKGIFSFLYQGERQADDDILVMLQVLVVAQIEIKERAKPSDVEKAELKLLQEFRRFSNSERGSEFHIKNVATSHQIEHPYGWVMINCEFGPMDLSEDSQESPEVDVVVGLSPNVGIGHESEYVPESEFKNEY